MIGQRIQELLRLQSKTPPELARYLDVTPQAAHKWITGQSEPRGKRKEAIARFFGVTPAELEYGPPVLLAQPRPEAFKVNATLTATIAEHQASLLIEAELKNIGQKSPEYISGMKDLLLSRLAGLHNESPYRPATCHQDAYEAGYAHAKILLDIQGLNPYHK